MKILLLISMIFVINGYPSSDNLDDQCLNYCSNDGICVIIKNQPQCYCLPEWEGELCKDPREYKLIQFDPSQRNQMSSARNHPCSLVPPNFCNGGLCQYDGTAFTCACPFDKAGTRCELASPCNDLCRNGGTCELATDLKATCVCPPQFTGTRCDVPVTTTTLSTISTTTESTTTTSTVSTTPDAICQAFKEFCNGGECVTENGRPKCQCPPTKTGDYCEIGTGTTAGPATGNPATSNPATGNPVTGNPATSNPATGNPATASPGTVNPGGNSDDACSSNPCQNNRPCYNNGNTFYCFCGNGFTGPTCATASG